MVFKSLLLSFLFLTLYSFYTSHRNQKINIHWGQNRWQDNQITAQNYLYSKKDGIENVYVGTSLSQSLYYDILLSSFCSMALGGQSIRDGLQVIDRYTFVPRRVFIECNLIYTIDNQDFVDDLFLPFTYYLKKTFPVFLDKNQPVVGFIRPKTSLICNKAVYPLGKGLVVPILEKINQLFSGNSNGQGENDFLNKFTKAEEKKGESLSDSLTLVHKYERVQQMIASLQKKGSEVIFYEMPISKARSNSELYQLGKRFTQRYFPPSKFVYLDFPTEEYKTSDGLHLRGEEATKYSHFFLDSYYKKIKQ